MTPSQIRPTAQALLEADSLTAVFAPVLTTDGVTDFSIVVDSALRKNGACFALSPIFGGSSESADSTTVATANLLVLLYEDPNTDHATQGDALFDAVVSALTRRHDFILTEWEKMENEKGGTLTVCHFKTIFVFTG